MAAAMRVFLPAACFWNRVKNARKLQKWNLVRFKMNNGSAFTLPLYDLCSFERTKKIWSGHVLVADAFGVIAHFRLFTPQDQPVQRVYIGPDRGDNRIRIRRLPGGDGTIFL
jgi:hypothetical protein